MKKEKFNEEDPQIKKVRHSLSHILATAILEKYPKTKLGIGPIIDNGFYYDFDFIAPISDTRPNDRGYSVGQEDLEIIEKRMKELVKQNLNFKKSIITYSQAKKIFTGNKYKLELIDELKKKKSPISIYETSTGNGKNKKIIFIDLCSGPHIKNTKEINPDGLKLMSLAGAYWKGSEKNKMLTRIYAVAFNTKEELEKHIKNEEEAKKRDHRKLGKELGIFAFDDIIGKGLPLWLPNGTIIKDEIEKLAKEKEYLYGYKRVSTPHLAKEELYLKSGHLPYYKESMYPEMKMDDGTYYLKAMNCPHHHMIYKSEPKSYKDLPLRLAEYGTCYRNELSGTLAGLLRVRSLQMNDAHIYCTKDQIEEEFRKVLEMTLEYFKIFGLNEFWFRLSKWDPKHKEKYIAEPANWKFSEDILRKIIKDLKVPFYEASNEAAFYGPKIDIQFKSIIGREETMSTVQLDFAAKKRFDLTYRDSTGKDNNEVFVIHRAPLSTHERFMAFLLEQYAGAFPTWLSPIQTIIIPVSEKHTQYAQKVYDSLFEAGVRVKLDDANETLGKRIRESEIKKIPYTLVVGDKEKDANTVSIRGLKAGQLGTKIIEDFIKDIIKEIKERK